MKKFAENTYLEKTYLEKYIWKNANEWLYPAAACATSAIMIFGTDPAFCLSSIFEFKRNEGEHNMY